jgi:sortase A
MKRFSLIMKKLSIVIIVIGVIIFTIPIIGQVTTNYLESKMISSWQNGQDLSKDQVYTTIYNVYNKIVDTFSVEKQSEQAFTDDLEDQTGDEVVSDEDFGDDGTNEDLQPTGNVQVTTPVSTIEGATSTPKPTVAPKPIKKQKKQEVIGIIKIPKIKVSLPIVEGVKKQNLRVGIGHFPGTAKLGYEGNSALAGHRSYALGKMFNRLNELVNGDMITIITKKGSYTYKVYEKFVVLPEDVYVLSKVKNDNVITLVTCTPVRIATHRLIVRARLMKE